MRAIVAITCLASCIPSGSAAQSDRPAAKQSAATADPVRAETAGKWSVDLSGDQCVASRTFRTGAGELLMILNPYPLREGAMLTLIGGSDLPRREGYPDVTFRTAPDGWAWTWIGSNVAMGDGRRALQVAIDGPTLARLRDAAELTVAVPGARPIAFRAGLSQRLLDAMGECAVALQTKWGFPPETIAAIATKAEPASDATRWITPADYPAAFLNAGAAAETAMILFVGADGRVSDCKPFTMRGDRGLHQVACRLMQQRARYKPARDVEGRAVASLVPFGVQFRLTATGGHAGKPLAVARSAGDAAETGWAGVVRKAG